jgi:hypothetical protein
LGIEVSHEGSSKDVVVGIGAAYSKYKLTALLVVNAVASSRDTEEPLI